MDYRFETSPLALSSPDIAPDAKYVRHVNVRFRLPRKAFMVCDAVRTYLGRIVRYDHTVAGNVGEEPLLKAKRAFRLSEIEKIVTEILLIDEPGFSSKLDGFGRIVELTEYGVGRFYHDENFLMGKVIDEDRGDTLVRYRVRPKVQLFFDACERHPIGKYGAQYFAPHPASRTPDGKQFRWKSYNELIEIIRNEAKARGLDKLDIANTFRSKRAFNSMMAVVKGCFAKRSRIFVVCIDLCYHVDWANKVSVDLAKDHHADFVNRLRATAKIKKYLIGAIWKFDWAEAKGHFFRWVFLFDGEYVQATWEYQDLVDDLWKSIVPKAAGKTLLLNDVERFTAGLGMIDLKKDRSKFEHFVESIIRYLAYKDQFLCIEREPGARTWGTLVPRNNGVAMAEAAHVDDLQRASDSTS